MSIRLKLEEENMDLLMSLVREYDMNPSEVLNMIFSDPSILSGARSKDNGDYARLTCRKCGKKGKTKV